MIPPRLGGFSFRNNKAALGKVESRGASDLLWRVHSDWEALSPGSSHAASPWDTGCQPEPVHQAVRQPYYEMRFSAREAEGGGREEGRNSLS